MSLQTRLGRPAAIRTIAILIALVSVATSIVTTFEFIGSTRQRSTLTAESERQKLIQQLEQRQAEARYEALRARRDSEVLRQELADLQRELAQVSAQAGKPLSAAATAKLAADLTDARAEIESATKRVVEIDSRITTLDERFAKIEEAILHDAQKAVSVPLLQKDLASLQQQTSRDLETIRAESSRLYDLMKLLIGLMGLISFGLLGTAIGNLFKRESKETPSREATTKTDAVERAESSTSA